MTKKKTLPYAGLLLISILFVHCVQIVTERSDLEMSLLVSDSTCIGARPEVSIVFTHRLLDSTLNFELTPGDAVIYLEPNISRDTFRVYFDGFLKPGTDYLIVPVDDIYGANNAKIFERDDSLFFTTSDFSIEQEPNGSRILADSLRGFTCGIIESGHDTDMYMMLKESPAGQMIFFRSEKQIHVQIMDALNDSTLTLMDDTISLGDSFRQPLYLSVFSLHGIAQTIYYECRIHQ